LNEAKDRLAESKQFDAFNQMSAFLVHDLKNIQAQLALINGNAKRHKDNPAFIADVFETVESATYRLDKVLMQLRNKQVAQSTNNTIDVKKLIDKVVKQRNTQLPKVIANTDVDISISINEEMLASVLNHLLQNSQEATLDDGWVNITAVLSNNTLCIDIIDNGCGMSESFIVNMLFKPLDTTKGNAGMGIGVYEAKQFIEGVNGTMNVVSEENEGSQFKIVIPCE
jgi:putative PEP-CTERM system histidine kinase